MLATELSIRFAWLEMKAAGPRLLVRSRKLTVFVLIAMAALYLNGSAPASAHADVAGVEGSKPEIARIVLL